MFHTKKSILTTIFIFFIFSHISALNVQDKDTDPCFNVGSNSETTTETTETETTQTDSNSVSTFDTSPYNFTNTTDVEKITSYTIAHEDHIIQRVEYINYETGEMAQGERLLYPDLMNEGRQQFNLPSDLNCNNQNHSNSDITHNSHSSNGQQEHDDFANKLKDDGLDSRRQEIENNQTPQTHAQQNNIRTIKREKALHELNKLRTSSDHPKAIFALPSVQAHCKQFKYDLTEQYRDRRVWFFSRKKTFPTAESEIKFADALPTKVGEYLSQIQYADQIDAKAAFAELKELWTWKRDHTFLTSGFIDGTGENSFIVHLGIDIMHLAERELISRPDYIAQHTDAESFKVIQEFREKCIALQQKGDSSALFKEELKLRQELFKNGKNDNLTTNICYAIVEKIYFNTITSVLHEIAHNSSLEKAHNQLHYLEMQILDQAQQHNITLTDQIKDFIVKQYGFDVIEAGYNCYTSRPDYIKKINDQPVLSNNNISPILHNIENKALPAAHKELIHLQKQIIGTLESLNITNTTTQKELIVKKFGIDVLEQANNTYKNRSDHKELINSFIPIDVQNNSINILNNSHDYASVGQQFDIMAKQVFNNARLCKLDFVENIENHIIDSLQIIKAPQNDAEFIFNVTVVDHLLTDIQLTTEAIVDGKLITWKRSSELFMRGLEKFGRGLNPITQVTNICHLLKDTAVVGYYILDDILDETLHPNPMEQKNFFLKGQVCESLVNSARFTTDLIFGSSYLSKEEYLQRHATFWKDYGSKITAEIVVDLTAQILADFVYCKGIPSIFIYLKEIDAATKMEKQIAKVAKTFKKGFETHLADNPIFVTAEGIQARIPGTKIVEYMEATNANPKNVAAKVEKTVEDTLAMIKRRGKQGSPYQEISKSTNTRPLDRLKGKNLIGIKDVSVSGYESLPKRVFLNNYEHYLQPELRTTTNGKIKPSGWHHDPGKSIERIKKVNGHKIEIINKEIRSSGVYRFEWGY